jgi:hypothetical protein
MKFDTTELCGTLDEDRGFNMSTCSGHPLWPADPRPEDIRAEDLVALARICRFNGHLKPEIETYSVMQHSIYVYKKVVRATGNSSSAISLAALLHDAHEYIYGDMIKPQKRLWSDRKHYEQIADRAIAKRFGFHVGLFEHPAIKEADYRTFLTEQRDLLTPGTTDFGVANAEPYDDIIVPEPFNEVVLEFMQILDELTLRVQSPRT